MKLSKSEKARVKELKQRADDTQPNQQTPVPAESFKVGAQVEWTDCPGSLSNWNPFKVRQIEDDMVWLDFVAPAIHRSKLTVTAKQ